jgi:phosphatidylserine/phosphatidylglycerophosphate/cardiolipin synthase-like enzyme
MRARAQRKGTLILLPVLLGGLALGIAGRTETTVRAIADLPGSCAYCRCVEEAFASSETSIDLLLADAELEGNPLWDGLLAAALRGVRVRVLLDASDWAAEITEGNRPAIEFLLERGIEARFDDPGVTTHAKLVIIDRRRVILGSTNWNEHAFTEQAQANVEVVDDQVGAALADYFERLWSGTLAPGAIDVSASAVSSGGTLVVALPDTADTRNYGEVLRLLLAQAERSIHVVMYRASRYAAHGESLSNAILDDLVAAAGRGLDVRVLLDDCAFYAESREANLEAALYLALHGVEVRFDDPDETTHAKLVVIDGETVLLGSTNWNYYSLEKNNEVDLAVIGFPALAATYEAFFRALWGKGRALTE